MTGKRFLKPQTVVKLMVRPWWPSKNPISEVAVGKTCLKFWDMLGTFESGGSRLGEQQRLTGWRPRIFLHQLEDLFSSWLSVNLSSCWLCWPLCQLSYRHRKYQLTSRRPAISIHRTSIFDAWHRGGHFSHSNPSRTIETLYFQWLTTVTVYIYGL